MAQEQIIREIRNTTSVWKEPVDLWKKMTGARQATMDRRRDRMGLSCESENIGIVPFKKTVGFNSSVILTWELPRRFGRLGISAGKMTRVRTSNRGETQAGALASIRYRKPLALSRRTDHDGKA